MPAAEAKKADDASDDTRRNPRPPLRTGRLACSHWSSVIIIMSLPKFKGFTSGIILTWFSTIIVDCRFLAESYFTTVCTTIRYYSAGEGFD